MTRSPSFEKSALSKPLTLAEKLPAGSDSNEHWVSPSASQEQQISRAIVLLTRMSSTPPWSGDNHVPQLLSGLQVQIESLKFYQGLLMNLAVH